jgi:hypothetical protein
MRTVSMLCLLAVACAGAPDPSGNVRSMALSTASRVTGSATVNVTDHGGLVLPSSVTYAVYWGNPADFPADLQTGMTQLLGGFNGSSYLGIMEQYMRGTPISSSFGGTLTDTSAPPSHPPKASDLGAEVCNLVGTPNPGALYIIFTSNAPKISYCAWHDKATCNGVTFQVAYMPNQAQLPGCSPYTKKNLGCNGYSDGTVTTADSVAHEFSETITDAHIDAWYDKNGAEIGDKCNYNYTACVKLGNGSLWQIQAEWSNAISGCQQQ